MPINERNPARPLFSEYVRLIDYVSSGRVPGCKAYRPCNKRTPNEGKQPSNLKHDPLNHAARTRFPRSMPGHQTTGVPCHYYPRITFHLLRPQRLVRYIFT